MCTLENREWGCTGLESVPGSFFQGDALGSEAIEDKVDAEYDMPSRLITVDHSFFS